MWFRVSLTRSLGQVAKHDTDLGPTQGEKLPDSPGTKGRIRILLTTLSTTGGDVPFIIRKRDR